MEKTLGYAIGEVEDIKKDKKVEEIMEKLGLIKKTKLEKLADSFTGVKYCIHPNKENQDLGFISFAYTGPYIFKEKESEIKKVAENFYNKDDYTVLVATSDDGFDIVIIEGIFKNLRTKRH
jgi:hypothetical protein